MKTTVNPIIRYLWNQEVSVFESVLIKWVNLRKMYGARPRKLFVITSVCSRCLKAGFHCSFEIHNILQSVSPAFIMRFKTSRAWLIQLFPLVFAIFVVD